MVKCVCGVELFSKDVVDFKINYIYGIFGTCIDMYKVPVKYRCPKCFKVKKVKVK